MQEYEEKNQNTKEKISHNIDELERIIINMKIQIEEEMRSQLNEKEENYENLEEEVVLIIKELVKTTD